MNTEYNSDIECEDIKYNKLEYIGPVPKKRGRKKIINNEENEENEKNENEKNEKNETEENEKMIENSISNTPLLAKKRGRKPKGGKIITTPTTIKKNILITNNIILHLKCSINDIFSNNPNTKFINDPLQYNPELPPQIMTYNIEDVEHFSIYEKEEENNSQKKIHHTIEVIEDAETSGIAYKDYVISSIKQTQTPHNTDDVYSKNINNDICDDTESNISNKTINGKLNKLKSYLYKTEYPDKKSACFWCTYEYDNHSCYIPKYESDSQMYGYGSFCRPECAVAYLMKENIDDSIKFERYNLLNYIYGKIYDYKKNIKPAPNPYYLLEKYYGNLTIQEYRKLLKSEHMLVVLEKPMTRILPEIHEDNEDITTNIYGSNSNRMKGMVVNGGGGGGSGGGQYKVKRQSEKQKGPSKNTIMKENFGIQ